MLAVPFLLLPLVGEKGGGGGNSASSLTILDPRNTLNLQTPSVAVSVSSLLTRGIVISCLRDLWGVSTEGKLPVSRIQRPNKGQES